MVSTKLEESDITEIMVFTMESSQRERIMKSFADIDPEQVFVLSQYVGDELEILDLLMAAHTSKLWTVL